MSRANKLINKIKQKPKDFTYEEAERLLKNLGFEKYNKGKTSGSREWFINKNINNKIELHKPHPNKVLKKYVIKNLLDKLNEIGAI